MKKGDKIIVTREMRKKITIEGTISKIEKRRITLNPAKIVGGIVIYPPVDNSSC